MVDIDVSKFKRDGNYIKGILTNKNNILATKADISILIPGRYEDRDLMQLGATITTISVYAIVDMSTRKYAVMNLPIFIELEPSSVDNITIGGNLYKKLNFVKGDIVSSNTTLVRKDDFVFNLFDEFFIKGKVPWFLSYLDASNILTQAKKYADSNIGNNPIAMEILVSIIARSEKDKKIPFRYTTGDGKDLDKKIVAYTGLQNPYYSFDNTVSKVAGSFFTKGLNSTIVDKQATSTKVEDILRA